MGIKFDVKHKFIVNGKEYNSIDELPAGVRDAYQKAVGLSGPASSLEKESPPQDLPPAGTPAGLTPPETVCPDRELVWAEPGTFRDHEHREARRSVYRIILISVVIGAIAFLAVRRLAPGMDLSRPAIALAGIIVFLFALMGIAMLIRVIVRITRAVLEHRGVKVIAKAGLHTPEDAEETA